MPFGVSMSYLVPTKDAPQGFAQRRTFLSRVRAHGVLARANAVRSALRVDGAAQGLCATKDSYIWHGFHALLRTAP
jgi:hypothetical protein